MKFCSECGTQLEDDAAFCSNCGKACAVDPPVEKKEKSTPSVDVEKAKEFSEKGLSVIKNNKKPIIITAVAAVVILGIVMVIGGLTKKTGGPENRNNGLIKEKYNSEAQAAYHYIFSDIIPFNKEIPYASITNDWDVEVEEITETQPGYDCTFHGTVHGPEYEYGTYTYAMSDVQGDLPYLALSYSYQDVLEDIESMNGFQEKEREMLSIMQCAGWGSVVSDINTDRETLNLETELLWYLTFYNYSCEVETEENSDGECIVRVRVHNTDMVKLLYEELEKTWVMVTEDKRQNAAETMDSSLNHIKDYFMNEAENRAENQSVHITAYPASGDVVAYPVYGDAMLSKLNLAAAVGGLALDGISYWQNETYWNDLCDDGTLWTYTLSNMFARIEAGDCDMVTTEMTFLATQDEEGNYVIPFDERYTTMIEYDPAVEQNEPENFAEWYTELLQYKKMKDSMDFADSELDSLVDVAARKGIATPSSGMDYGNGYFHSWGADSLHNYQSRILYFIMGWRGTTYR